MPGATAPKILSVLKGKEMIGAIAVTSSAQIPAALKIGFPDLDTIKFTRSKNGSVVLGTPKTKKSKKVIQTSSSKSIAKFLQRGYAELPKKERKKAENSLKTQKSKVDDLAKQMKQAIKDKEATEAKIAQLKEKPATLDWMKTAERLLALDGVEDVSFKNNLLKVYTAPIHARVATGDWDYGKQRQDEKVGKKLFNLGRYILTIDLKEKRVRPSKPKVIDERGPGFRTDLIHPHIAGDGYVCWGDMSGNLTMLIETGMLPELVTMLIRYLRTINGNEYNESSIEQYHGWKEVKK